MPESSDSTIRAIRDADLFAVNALRCLGADIIQRPNSGHPGSVIGLAPIMHVLFRNYLRFSPRDPAWAGRDRFVLSSGHVIPLFYALQYAYGMGVTLSDLKHFRSLHARCSGSAEPVDIGLPLNGVEIATGSLGQGVASAVGIAIAQRLLLNHVASLPTSGTREDAAKLELLSLLSARTVCICGDGCIQTGVAAEACSLAGTLGLGNLILIYDNNGVSSDGDSGLAFTEDVAGRYRAYGWRVLNIEDGDYGLEEISAVLGEALGQHPGDTGVDSQKPTLIIVKTTIGLGSPAQGTSGCHSLPLGEAGVRTLKRFFGQPEDEHYYIPPRAAELFRATAEQKRKECAAWDKRVRNAVQAFPAATTTLRRLGWSSEGGEREDWPVRQAGHPGDEAINLFDETINAFLGLLEAPGESGGLATRQASQKVLSLLAGSSIGPYLVSGGADLLGSCLAKPDGFLPVSRATLSAVDGDGHPGAETSGTDSRRLGDPQPASSQSPQERAQSRARERYIHYGIREHAMCAISNGISAHGFFLPLDSTFLIFFSYCAAAIRNGAACSLFGVHAFTHDSVMLGEDGKTHQPVETVAWLRSTPRIVEWRPANLLETYGAYLAILSHGGPPETPFDAVQHVLCLSRQKIPALYPDCCWDTPREVGIRRIPGLEGIRRACEATARGGYVFSTVGGEHPPESEETETQAGAGAGETRTLTLVSSGAEVALCVRAAQRLAHRAKESGNTLCISVVSMPSYTVFRGQPQAYREEVLPALSKAGFPTLWVEPYTAYGVIGRLAHAAVSLEDFGESGAPRDLAEQFGLTEEEVCRRGLELLKRGNAPPLEW